MREIKFRAWDKKENILMTSMVYDWCLCFGFAPELPTTVKTNWDNPNLLLMQFTWLQDKNWVDIYEWDIVRDEDYWYNQMNYEVEFYEWRYGAFYDYEQFLGWKVFTIIWNIYENPELITP